MVMLVLMVVAAAALLIVVVVMVMLVLMVVAAAALLVVVVVMVMFVLMVMAAAALLIMIVMMVMLVLMVMAAAALFIVIVMMVMFVGFLLQLGQFGLQSVLLFHGHQHLGAGQFLPGGGDDGGGLVVLAQQSHGILQFLFAHAGGAGQHDAAGVGDLVVEELTEVLHIHLALARVGHGGKAVEDGLFHLQTLHGADDVGQFAHTGGLDEDAVGMVLLQHLTQCLSKVAHQTAADAAGVHLGDLDAGILQKAAVDADLAELVFDEHQFFALIGFLNEFFDQRGLTRAEKTGKDIDLGHVFASFMF